MLEMQQEKQALPEGLFSDKTPGKFKLTEQDLQGLLARSNNLWVIVIPERAGIHVKYAINSGTN